MSKYCGIPDCGCSWTPMDAPIPHVQEPMSLVELARQKQIEVRRRVWDLLDGRTKGEGK